ncbi:MAG: hypothetical protein KAJ78_04950 [Acidobacteria bacterium]|nr:hypothetical protein [Acidobacteriota bacterium]
MRVKCSQCGAGIPVPADTGLLQCPFCDTALVVDAGDTLFRVVTPPTINASGAVDHLRRFMAGTQTVADLDAKARIGDPELLYFPFWAFRIATDAGEQVVLEPAAPSSLQGMQKMTLPPGDTRSWTDDIGGGTPVVQPEVPQNTARQWMVSRLGDVQVLRTVLYHLPMFRFSYDYRGRSYRAAVDGVSGQVFPADFPAKAEAPFVAVAALAIGVFSIEGLIVSNLLLKAVVYCVSAVPILLLAWWISRKV